MSRPSGLCSTWTIAEYLDFRDHKTGALNRRAAEEWVRRYIPKDRVRKVGKTIRVHIDDVDAACPPKALPTQRRLRRAS